MRLFLACFFEVYFLFFFYEQKLWRLWGGRIVVQMCHIGLVLLCVKDFLYSYCSA